ncbi:hypothetical protein [uncultured Sharpea sp.]|uniref:hypothetical protein n=1 Tax=uncultured Sharpea sp. TaxID=1112738 RepID=UPI00258D07F5|nr:hypothetical protein [uncultured Sharpea sp.]
MKTKRNWQYWWTLLYWPIYLAGFAIVERLVPLSKAHIISTSIDYAIPKREYFKMMTVLYVGMTIFIVVSAIYPNGLDIRPEHLGVNSFSTWVVSLIYRTDTPTNVIPSIHIYNSIGMAIGLCKSDYVKPYIKRGSVILAFLITIATFFVKQHGIVDAIAAIILVVVMYFIVYKKDCYFLRGANI